MKRKFAILLAGVLVSTGLSMVASPAAQAASCDGTYTIVVGGFNDTTSSIFTGNVSQRVGYSAALNSQSARQGVDELNRLIRDQRWACPSQHAKVVGFSEGAAVAHIWVTENWRRSDRRSQTRCWSGRSRIRRSVVLRHRRLSAGRCRQFLRQRSDGDDLHR
jgi:cutinase